MLPPDFFLDSNPVVRKLISWRLREKNKEKEEGNTGGGGRGRGREG